LAGQLVAGKLLAGKLVAGHLVVGQQPLSSLIMKLYHNIGG
jgi:hypothetical protein